MKGFDNKIIIGTTKQKRLQRFLVGYKIIQWNNKINRKEAAMELENKGIKKNEKFKL